MGIEYIFLIICTVGLVCFASALAFNTAIMGKSYCKGFQFMWSSLPKSKDADAKIKFLLNKLDANLIKAELYGESRIAFYPLDDENKTNPDAEIWIGNKYFSYGWLYSYGGVNHGDFIKKRPSHSTFKRILELESKLNGQSTTNAPPTIERSNKEKVVHLE